MSNTSDMVMPLNCKDPKHTVLYEFDIILELASYYLFILFLTISIVVKNRT